MYGLVDQPRFFDVIRHQLFYFPLLHSKVATPSPSWPDRLKSYLYGPGWFPGLPRLGDNNLVQERPERSLHFSQINLMMHLNNLLQLVPMICVHDQLSSSLASHHFSQVRPPLSLSPTSC